MAEGFGVAGQGRQTDERKTDQAPLLRDYIGTVQGGERRSQNRLSNTGLIFGDTLAVDANGVFSVAVPFLDSVILVKDPVDPTKTMRIDVGAVSQNETRVLTMPDRDVDLAVAVIDDGTTSLPGLRFNNDPDTGLIGSNDSLVVVVGGVEIVHFLHHVLKNHFTISSGVDFIHANWIYFSQTGSDSIFRVSNYSSVSIPAPSLAGQVIWNTTNAALNIDNGSSWAILPTLPFVDSASLVRDPVTASKTMRIDTGAVADATTRVLIMPNQNVDLTPNTGTFPALVHATRHESGGGDAIKLDNLATPDDNENLDSSATEHGLLKKLDNVSTNFLNGTGAWAVPTGSTPAFLDLGTPSTLTIATGAITITGSYHLVDTESAASDDLLVTINGGINGRILIIRPVDNDREIFVRSTGNIQLSADFDMAFANDSLTLIYNGSEWIEIVATSVDF